MSDPIGAITSRLSSLQGGGIGGAAAPTRDTLQHGKGDGATGTAGTIGGPSCGAPLTQTINQGPDAQARSPGRVPQFIRVETARLHQVMAAGEEAGIALEMLIELRNKFTDAYRALINMQS